MSAVASPCATRALAEATARRTPCPPVRTLLPANDLDAAYAVQSAGTDARIAAGRRVVGRKIGLTNRVVQAQLGVDQPDFGVLFDDMDCSGSAAIDIGRLLQPRIEAEIAFVLSTDLDAARISPVDVIAATRHLAVALEIVDSRIAAWDISIVDTVADNASSGLFVLGERARPLGDLDLTTCAMTMRRGGELVSSGRGADCLGNPLAAVAWLANTAREFGTPLRAGEIILSGALGPVVPVQAGAVYTAEVGGLGAVTARFTAAGTAR